MPAQTPVPCEATTIQTRTTTTTTSHHPPATSLVCGLTAGILQAGLFNPYDRALYLSVTQKRPFLHAANWKHPYSGVFQSLGIRALSGGLYFPIEHWLLQQQGMTPAVAGSLTGMVTAGVVNPLTALKYQTWSTKVRTSSRIQRTTTRMRMSSPNWMLRGLGATIVRDLVFGGVYTAVRVELRDHTTMGGPANLMAAVLATVASGPWNYVRNVQYAAGIPTKSSNHATDTSSWSILSKLVQQTARQPTIFQAWTYLSARLRIGWGTARVASGMAFGHAVYDGLLTTAHVLWSDK